MAVRYRATNDFFHCWLRLIWSRNQVRWWDMLKCWRWIDPKDLLLPVRPHNSRFIFPVRCLSQILLQLSIRQLLRGPWQLVRRLLSQVQITSLRLLHLLHVIIGLHLIIVVIIILSILLLFLWRSHLQRPRAVLLVLIVESRIDSDLVV